MVFVKITFVLLCKILKNKTRGRDSLPGVCFKMLYAVSLKVTGLGNIFSEYIKAKK